MSSMNLGTGLIVVEPDQIRPKRTSGLFKNCDAALSRIAAEIKRVTSIGLMLHCDRNNVGVGGRVDAERAERRDGFL